jgi:Bifunctional DNA primase/polymerase, N-terminal/Primase C terminal 1 (PriCT-1)
VTENTRLSMPGQHQPESSAPSIPPHSRILRAALWYGERGKPVFPCKPDKSPYTGHGFKDATADRSRIHAYWSRHRGASIGMPTGERSGFFVLDVDRLEALEELEARIGKLPATLTVRTPSGGLHLYFPHADGITNSTGGLPESIDVRGEGGYVLTPPSAGYSWESRVPVADAPPELLELIRERRSTEGTPERGSVGVVPDGEPIPEGQRNTTMFFVALDLKDSGMSQGQALENLRAINEARCVPPLDVSEVEQIVKSAYRYPVMRRGPSPEVRELVDELKRAWWATAWRGVGGKTERDVVRVLIEWAERYGHLVADGVRFTLSWRTLALASACSFRTVSRVVPRLKEKGWLTPDNASRSGTEAGAFVLRPRPTDITRVNFSYGGASVTASDVTLARLPVETPCFRWRGYVAKGKAGVLNSLEVFGPQSREELAEMLGFSRPRDLERKYLVPLVALGLVEDRGGIYALCGDYRERVEEVRSIPYGSGERKVRKKDASGRMVSYVREIPAMSEKERDELDRRAYAEQSRRFAERVVRNSPEADAACIALLNELDRERERVAGADGLISELEHTAMLTRLTRSQSGWQHADRHLESLGFASEWFGEVPANGEPLRSGLLDSSEAVGHSGDRLNTETTGRIA